MRVIAFAASLLVFLVGLAGCSGSSSSADSASGGAGGSAPQLARGPWHGALTVAGNQRLPFELTVLPDSAGQPRALLHNGGETFRLTEFDHGNGDSLQIRLHVFDAVLIGRVERKSFTGYWQKLDAKTPFRVPFRLMPGRAPKPQARPALNFGGKWAVKFQDAAEPVDPASVYPAVGVFEQKGNVVTGTFLTETGDYRFLRGYAHKDSLRLFTFDGAHGYVFNAVRQPDGSLRGDFWSGLKGHETWTARLDPNARLADAESITGMKPGQDSLTFTFPDLHGRPVSSRDPRFRGKVVIVQLLGTWCPNCMDETAYLAPFYRAHRAQGLELIGLAYERTRDTATVHPRLRRLAKRYGMEYPILLAGIASSDSAAASLPQLRDVKAFPTTIFIGRDGRVRRVHTGFSGPGTGKYYEEWKREFDALVKEMLAA